MNSFKKNVSDFINKNIYFISVRIMIRNCVIALLLYDKMQPCSTYFNVFNSFLKISYFPFIKISLIGND